MANEIDAGQERGEVATRADNQHVRASDKQPPATYDELGVRRQQVHEWRQARDTGEEKVEATIQEAFSGRNESAGNLSPTWRRRRARAGILAAKGPRLCGRTMKPHKPFQTSVYPKLNHTVGSN